MPKQSNNLRFWKYKLNKYSNKHLLKFIKRLRIARLIYSLLRRLQTICWYIWHPREDRYSYYDNPQPELVLATLKADKLPITELNTQFYLPGFRGYLERTREIYRQEGYFRIFDENGYFFEKALEHYLSIELLEFCQDDTVLDVGSWCSPFAVIAERERM